MAVNYTSKNKLKLINTIQRIAQENLDDDRSYRWIWRNKIYPVYFISYSTFLNYISVPQIRNKIKDV